MTKVYTNNGATIKSILVVDGYVDEIDIGHGYVKTERRDNYIEPVHSYHIGWDVNQARPDVIVYVDDCCAHNRLVNELLLLGYKVDVPA